MQVDNHWSEKCGSHLTKEDTDQIRISLLKHRKQALEDISRLRALIHPDGSPSGDFGDKAQQLSSLSLNAEMLSRNYRLIADVDIALMKIRERRFGYCELTGEPIARRRLFLQPWCRYGVMQAGAIEKSAGTLRNSGGIRRDDD